MPRYVFALTGLFNKIYVMEKIRVKTPHGVIECVVDKRKNGYVQLEVGGTLVVFHEKSGSVHPTAPAQFMEYRLDKPKPIVYPDFCQ